MRFYRNGLIILTAVLLITLFSGCSESKPTEVIAGPEYAGAITEEILLALNTGDYAVYTKNFDEAMEKAMQEPVFSQMREFFQKKIGLYESKKISKVEVGDVYTTVVYKAKFSDEPKDVTVTIVFLETEDKVLVSGLWFDSPKLREQ